MGFSRGPKIVTDGLVLYLDAANVSSFRGEPTTNIADNDSARTIQFHNQVAYGNAGTISDAPEKGLGWKKITITNRGNNFRIAQMPYVFNSSGVVYSYSLEVDMGSTSGYYWRIDGSGGYGALTIIDNKVQTTITPSINGSFAIFLNHNTTGISGISETIYYRYYQVEQKPYSTFFTETSRGTTVTTGGGWVDRSGNNNHGELVNGPTFNSGNLGSISFDGVDDFISIPNITMGNGNIPWTISTWTKTTTTVNALGQGSIISNSSGGPVYSMLGVNNGRIVYWTYQNNAWSQKLGNSIINDGNWHNLTWVNYQNSTMDMYVDGILDSNVTNSTSGNNNPLNIIGASWAARYSGLISNLSIYKNKSLTTQEVLQNYNATKSRYGL
jgi:hypothetical protein